MVLAGAALAALVLPAAAQDYPNKPVKVVVPFAAGGGTDIYARIWAEEMSRKFGQRFLVENMPGAAGAIGTKAGIASEADGYTLVMGVASTIAINPHTMGDIGYSPLTELAPIALLAYTPWVMVAADQEPYNTVAEMIEYDKANPGKLTFGTWTSTGEMGRKLLQVRTGVELLGVPYDGAVAALNDLVAGRASVAMLDLATAVPFLASGDIKGLAVTGPETSELTPGMPAIDDSGVTDFDVNSWVALFAPAGTPEDIIAKVNEATVEALTKPEIREKLAGLGAEVFAWNPQEVTDFVTTQSGIWAGVVAETGSAAD
jgi:tripartite-type tricarboxylate transporter receptor subunit TctC